MERPYNLMESLAAVRNCECNIQDLSDVISSLHAVGQGEVASWLEINKESYGEIMNEFSQWFLDHSHYQRESIDQEAAKTTGLPMPED